MISSTIDPQIDAIFFLCDDKKYKLHPDARPPQLYEKVMPEGKEELWQKCELA